MNELIAETPLFSGLGASAIDLAAGCATNVAFDEGERLLLEGEEADTFFLIRRGQVAIQVRRPSGKPIVIETIGPGKILGLSWLVPPYRWHFDAVATEPVGAVAIDGLCLRKKADEEPAFGYAILQRIAQVLLERLQATRTRLLDVYGRDLVG
ncbi:MAG: cyclic nucleotide-binding domain-containing protein [Acidimicrobiales bacterium]